MGAKTKIDWADATWNPVTGCLHGCEYCYARKIAQRFGKCKIRDLTKSSAFADLEEPCCTGEGRINPYPYEFLPTFHRYRLDEPMHWKKPRNIFVCSMADLFGSWVPGDWIEEVFEACEAAPQHRYMFLTKNPKRIMQYEDKHPLMMPDRENFWYGTTVTSNMDYERAYDLINWHDYNGANIFVSVEPLLGPIWKNGRDRIAQSQWVIIGAESGNRKEKVIPQREWIDFLVEDCVNIGTPVFMKESLRSIMGDDFIQQFPWEV